MPEERTWEVLERFGFEPDTASDRPAPTLCFHSPGFRLDALALTTPEHGAAIVFSAVVADGRRVSEVSFVLPRRVESQELAAALIAASLDKHLGPGFEGKASVAWLTMGRRNRDLLPWERDRVAHSLRPRCEVDRDWLRTALKKLRQRIPEAADGSRVVFCFDGDALRIQLDEETLLMAAEGRRWPKCYSVPAKHLLVAPKRLMRETVTVEYWEGHLTIDRRRFSARPEER